MRNYLVNLNSDSLTGYVSLCFPSTAKMRRGNEEWLTRITFFILGFSRFANPIPTTVRVDYKLLNREEIWESYTWSKG